MKAVLKAQMWLDESWEHREEAVQILSKDAYVKAPVEVLKNL